MSVIVMGWVWKHSRSKGSARLALLAIADAASDDGTNAWPSVNTLASKANVSDRSIQLAIKELIALGELKVEWNKGQNGSNRYTVLMPTPEDSSPPKTLRGEESSGVKTGTNSDIASQEPPKILRPEEFSPPKNLRETPEDSSPKPSLNHPSSSSKKSSSARKRNAPAPEHPLFAEFWSSYPRREGKGKAREAFMRVISNGTAPEILVSAAARYASYHTRAKTELKYIAHPTTWLNQERWEDDYGNGAGSGGQPPPALPPHCGLCDLPDRTVELPDGAIAYCPDCHPNAERNRQ